MVELAVAKEAPLTPQSAATRARIIATAERLFAERGIEATSLSDINIAAGQRNKNATHYHFGDKKGLLQAIIDKHAPGIIARRDRLLDELLPEGGYSVQGVVRALLYPLAEKLFDGNGGREFIRINAQLAAAHAAVFNEGRTDTFNPWPMDRLNKIRAEFLNTLPAPIAHQRTSLAISLILNGLADHSRQLDAGARGPSSDTELFIRNLEDCLVALCTAPVSPQAAQVLQRLPASAAPPQPPAAAPRKRRRA